MPVEMIGWIAPRVSSEIIPPSGPPFDPEVIAETARIHEHAGFDRVLIGYFSDAPDGFLVGAHAAAVTDAWFPVGSSAGVRGTATVGAGASSRRRRSAAGSADLEMLDCVGESDEHRVNHFQRLYDLQQETGGFTAFIPWSFQPQNTALGGRHWDEATAVDYLKVLAISRIFLSNFLNVQSSWVTQGLKVCQMGLRFGGNVVGSVMLEENVVRAAGVTNCTTEEELRRIIRDAGFRPAQRDTLYRQYFLN